MVRQPPMAQPMAECMVQSLEGSRQGTVLGRRALLSPPATLLRLPMVLLANSRQGMEGRRYVWHTFELAVYVSFTFCWLILHALERTCAVNHVFHVHLQLLLVVPIAPRCCLSACDVCHELRPAMLWAIGFSIDRFQHLMQQYGCSCRQHWSFGRRISQPTMVLSAAP